MLSDFCNLFLASCFLWSLTWVFNDPQLFGFLFFFFILNHKLIKNFLRCTFVSSDIFTSCDHLLEYLMFQKFSCLFCFNHELVNNVVRPFFFSPWVLWTLSWVFNVSSSPTYHNQPSSTLITALITVWHSKPCNETFSYSSIKSHNLQRPEPT